MRATIRVHKKRIPSGDVLCFVLLACFLFAAVAHGRDRAFSIEDFIQYRDMVPFERADISPDGALVSYAVFAEKPAQKGEDYLDSGVRSPLAGAAVYVLDLKSKVAARISAKGANAFGARWSPDSLRLAFFTDEGGVLQLAIWDRKTAQARVIQDVHVRQDMLSDAPYWSQTGSIFVRTYSPGETWRMAKLEPQESASEHTIVSVKTHLRSELGGRSEPTDVSGLMRSLDGETDVVEVRPDSGAIRRICRGHALLRFQPSPDGKSLSVLANLRLRSIGHFETQTDLYVVPLGDSIVTLSSENILIPDINAPRDGFVSSWSPDSSRIAFMNATISPEIGEMAIVDLQTKQVRSATAGFVIPDAAKWADYQEISAESSSRSTDTRFSVVDEPQWSADGRFLYIVGKGNIWAVSANSPKQEIANLTAGLSQPVLHLLRPLGKTQSFLLAATPRELVRVPFVGGKPEGLSTEKVSFGRDVDVIAFRPAQIPSAQSFILFTGSERTKAKDFFLLSLGAKAGECTLTQLTHMNPQLDNISWAERRLLKWQTLDGISAEGILLLPKSWDANRKLPLIAWVYGGIVGQTQMKDDFGFLSEEVLVGNGYAVLIPDIPISGIGTPYKQIANGVLPAVDAAVATGLIDADRIGLFGHSYGGYTVNALICQSDRFKAGISADGIADLPSVYLGPSLYGTAWAEGQGRMGGTLWQQTSRYIENSPLYHYESVKTPLLIIHGKKDSVVPEEESLRMYRALARLGKDVELAVYPDAEHSYLFWPEPQERDFFERVLGWFDRFVKREPGVHASALHR